MRITVATAALVLLAAQSWTAAQDKLDLRLHLSKGQTHQMHVTLDETIDQILGPAHQQTVQAVGVTYIFKVEDVDAQGHATISVKYNAVTFHARTPSGVVDYDPGKPANGPMPVTVTALAALIGQSYSIIVGPHGSVEQVSGAGKILTDVLAHLNVSDAVLRAAVEKTLRQQLSEPNLKQSLHDVFAPFPDRPVAIGESWTRNSPVNLGFPMKVETTYTLESLEDGVAKIAISGKAATDANAVLDLGPVKMDYNLKGEQAGTLEIIESSGWARAASVSQTLSGSATIRGPNVEPQTVPVTIQTIVKSEQK